MNYELRTLGKRLQYIRERLGLSRKDVEERYKISANTLKAWELGKSEAGIFNLIKYLDIFNKEYECNISLDKLAKPDEKAMDYLETCFDRSYMGKEINGEEQFDLEYLSQAYPLLKQLKEEVSSFSNNLINTLEVIIKEREEMFQVLFDNLPIVIVYKDENNNMTRMNTKCANMLGGNTKDFENKSCYSIFSEDLSKKYHNDDIHIIDNNSPRFDIIEEYRTKTGEQGWLKSAKIPIFNTRTGKPIILGIAQFYDFKKKRIIGF